MIDNRTKGGREGERVIVKFVLRASESRARPTTHVRKETRARAPVEVTEWDCKDSLRERYSFLIFSRAPVRCSSSVLPRE